MKSFILKQSEWDREKLVTCGHFSITPYGFVINVNSGLIVTNDFPSEIEVTITPRKSTRDLQRDVLRIMMSEYRSHVDTEKAIQFALDGLEAIEKQRELK